LAKTNQLEELKQICSNAEAKAIQSAYTGQRWQLKLNSTHRAYSSIDELNQITSNYIRANDTSVTCMNELNASAEMADSKLSESNELLKQSTDLANNSNYLSEQVHKQDERLILLNESLALARNLTAKTNQTIRDVFNATVYVYDQLSNLPTIINDLNNNTLFLSSKKVECVEAIRNASRLLSLNALFSGSFNRPKSDSLLSGNYLAGEREQESNTTTPEIAANAEEYDGVVLSLVESYMSKISLTEGGGERYQNAVSKMLQLNNDTIRNNLAKLRTQLSELKLLVAHTRQILNDIAYPVNFTNSTVLYLKPHMDMQPSMSTFFSVYFKMRQLYAPIVLIYNESSFKEYMAVYVHNGMPCVQYKIGNNLTPTVLQIRARVNDDRWYKLETERIGKKIKLRLHDGYGEPAEVETESESDSVVFKLDPFSTKIVVGQFPLNQLSNDLRPLAAYNNQFEGLIDSVKINGHTHGLWNFVTATNVKPVRIKRPQWIENSNEDEEG
jgi:hypothetical protein